MTVPSSSELKPIDVGLMGTGEYTTGLTPGGQSKSDKKIGVVGVTMFDLRRRGKVGSVLMAGTNGIPNRGADSARCSSYARL